MTYRMRRTCDAWVVEGRSDPCRGWLIVDSFMHRRDASKTLDLLREIANPTKEPERDLCPTCSGGDMVIVDGQEANCPNSDCYQGLVKSE